MPAIEQVSIIMPCYNGAQTIKKSVLSVLAQTYQDFRMYIVNDGSTDETASILESLRNEFPDITIITQANQGQTRAKNAALEFANGKYIALIDADDLWHPNKLEKQITYLENHPDTALCYSNGKYIDEFDNQTGTIGIEEAMQGNCFERLLMGNAIVASSVVFKSCLVARVGKFDERLTACENWELWTRISRVGRLHGIDESLVFYRRHQNNISHNIASLRENRLKVIMHNEVLYRDSFPKITKMTKESKFKAHCFFGENYLWHLNPIKARRDLLKALALRPFNLHCYKLLFKTFMPSSLLQILRRLKGVQIAQPPVSK